MKGQLDNLELGKYYKTLQQDIRSEQISDEEGGTLEQIFTRYASDLLTEAGEIENFRVAYDEKVTKAGVQHKINGYSIADNYETLDLLVTVYQGSDQLNTIGKGEIDVAAKRATTFFKNAVYKDYVKDIEESSEIFQLAHTLAESKDIKETLVRANIIIITDGVYAGDAPSSQSIHGYSVFYRVVDINYLYNISEKSHVPIEIDFLNDGFKIPCIPSPTTNAEYQAYLAIIPGDALVSIYEKYGSRLLEQNVRSFLQFTGKVNGGIRRTILSEPHMFLAFNNGITATAESVEVVKAEDGDGFLIGSVNDLQIVNGGQTTASIYHTWKKDRQDVSGIRVQLKLSVIKNKEKFSSIVSQISEYANTQNKVSISDLSSNRPFHIELEKISRSIWTPALGDRTVQTRWFYERARGQYRNARLKEGFTKAKQKAFDIKNPKSQVFTKEDLAKFINSFCELSDGKKILIGPHYVVRGSQKNYSQFINHNLPKTVDNVYYEDAIAKAIIFKTAEKKYGVKPNSIGDMRYVTVPYSIAYMNTVIKSPIDLYKIWRNQRVSDELSDLLYNLMVQVEEFIKTRAPGSLYGEWAKKEDCWNAVKEQIFEIDLGSIKDDLFDAKKSQKRKIVSEDEAIQLQIAEEIERIKSVPAKVWLEIEKWGKETDHLSIHLQDIAWKMSLRLKKNGNISDIERQSALKILDKVVEYAPEMLFEIDETEEVVQGPKIKTSEVTLELIKKMLDWDRKNKRLKPHHFTYLNDIVGGKSVLTEQAKKYVLLNLSSLEKYGFKY